MVWFGVAATIGLAIACLFAVLARLIREDYPRVFHELGEPGLIPKHLSTPDWKFFRFLWFGEFRRLGDSRVNRLCALLILHQLAFALWIVWPLVL